MRDSAQRRSGGPVAQLFLLPQLFFLNNGRSLTIDDDTPGKFALKATT